jgi:hypothetical protein
MKILLCSLKFAAGFASNLVAQIVRAICNLFGSIALLLAVLVLGILALLQFVGGGKRHAHETASLSWVYLKCAAGMVFSSTLQALGIISLIGPSVRAAQACTEGIFPKGIYAPNHQSLNFWQSVFGLNSWQPYPKKEVKVTVQQREVETPVRQQRKNVAKTNPTMRVVRKKPTSPDWTSAVREHLESTTREKRDTTRISMAVKHPVLYMKALKAAKKAVHKKGSSFNWAS